jgi:hypothetical protein
MTEGQKPYIIDFHRTSQLGNKCSKKRPRKVSHNFIRSLQRPRAALNTDFHKRLILIIKSYLNINK